MTLINGKNNKIIESGYLIYSYIQQESTENSKCSTENRQQNWRRWYVNIFLNKNEEISFKFMKKVTHKLLFIARIGLITNRKVSILRSTHNILEERIYFH